MKDEWMNKANLTDAQFLVEMLLSRDS